MTFASRVAALLLAFASLPVFAQAMDPSELPPVDSVIHWPLVQKVAGSRLVRRGRARSMSGRLPLSCSVRAAPSVMARGQV